MKVFELLNFNKELLEKMSRAGIRMEDVKYIDLYSDYQSFANDGAKTSYAVTYLSEKYDVSERTVYAVIKRFQNDCN